MSSKNEQDNNINSTLKPVTVQIDVDKSRVAEPDNDPASDVIKSQTAEQVNESTTNTDKTQVSKKTMFLNFFIILLQIAIKIATFVLLIKYYNTLNDKATTDNNIRKEDYIYIYYIAVSNIVFTVATIISSLIAIYVFYKIPGTYSQYKKWIEIIISGLWILSTILTIISTLVRSHIKEKYNKYLGNVYDKYIDVFSWFAMGIFLLLLFEQYIVSKK
jgi:magnesium-transporting ATPase (P-type)